MSYLLTIDELREQSLKTSRERKERIESIGMTNHAVPDVIRHIRDCNKAGVFHYEASLSDLIDLKGLSFHDLTEKQIDQLIARVLRSFKELIDGIEIRVGSNNVSKENTIFFFDWADKMEGYY